MDEEIIKKVVKDTTDFWDENDIHFVIYDRLFIQVFDNYQDFKEYVLSDDFFIENLKDPNLAVIENYYGSHRIISTHRIKSRYKTLEEREG